MAVVALLMGSILGMTSGVIGWAFLGMSTLSALALYVTLSLGFATFAIAAAVRRQDADDLMLQSATR